MSIQSHRSPYARARRLQRRNRLARHALLRWSLPPSLVLLSTACLWGASRPAWILFLGSCAAHPLLLGVLTLAITAMGTSRHKRRVQSWLARSWLAALPVKAPLLQEVARLPLAVGSLVLLAVGVALIAGLPPADAAGILLPLAVGAGTGFITGWRWPRAEPVMTPDSWYATLRRVRDDRLRPSLPPLGYWALARTRVWGRPQVTAKQVLIVLLGVPLGASAAQALAAVAATLLAWHLVALLAAVARVARAAAWWLAPTPIRLGRFTAALVHLAWLRQAAVCALVLAAIASLGRAALLHRGTALVGAWLAVCAISGSIACAIAWRWPAHGG